MLHVPESGLSRLMQRIQRQRETWVDRSSHGGVAVGDMASAHDAQQKKQPIPPGIVIIFLQNPSP